MTPLLLLRAFFMCLLFLCHDSMCHLQSKATAKLPRSLKGQVTPKSRSRRLEPSEDEARADAWKRWEATRENDSKNAEGMLEQPIDVKSLWNNGWDPEALEPKFWLPSTLLSQFDIKHADESPCSQVKDAVAVASLYGRLNNYLIEFIHLIEIAVVSTPPKAVILDTWGLEYLADQVDIQGALGSFACVLHEDSDLARSLTISRVHGDELYYMKENSLSNFRGQVLAQLLLRPVKSIRQQVVDFEKVNNLSDGFNAIHLRNSEGSCEPRVVRIFNTTHWPYASELGRHINEDDICGMSAEYVRWRFQKAGTSHLPLVLVHDGQNLTRVEELQKKFNVIVSTEANVIVDMQILIRAHAFIGTIGSSLSQNIMWVRKYIHLAANSDEWRLRPMATTAKLPQPFDTYRPEYFIEKGEVGHADTIANDSELRKESKKGEMDFTDYLFQKERKPEDIQFNWRDYEKTPSGQRFIHVDDDKIWVYGGFWDYRIRDRKSPNAHQEYSPVIESAPYVRVLLIGPYQNFVQILEAAMCVFIYDDDTHHEEKSPLTSVYASRVDDIYPENGARPYFVTCTPPNLQERIPLAMTLAFPHQSTASWSKDLTGYRRYYIFPIRGQFDGSMQARKSDNSVADLATSLKESKAMKHKQDPRYPLNELMLCVKPARNGIFHDFHLIAAFIAYYHVLGVSHFILFDSGSFNPRIYKIFNIAAKVGISIEVRPWEMREPTGWENHQVLFNEICIYDAMDLKYDNVAIVDYDEYIVPKNVTELLHNRNTSSSNAPATLIDLINELDREFPIASNYKFEHECFTRKKISHSASDGSPQKTASVLPYFHNVQPHLPEYPGQDYKLNHHTKHIYKPFRIGEVFIHSTTSANGQYHEVQVSTDVAKLHHYRSVCKSPEADQLDTTIPDLYFEAISSSNFFKEVVKLINFDGPSGSM